VAIEDALRLNVSAITLSVFVGSEGERQSLLNLATLVDAGERYGMPVLAVTAIGKEMTRDARYLGLCCRIAAEIGARFVKTYYCEGFAEIVRATPVPLIIAGGKKTGEREAVELAANAMRAGAAGVDMGRNIFQSDCPVGMIRAIRAVVHAGASVAEGFALYEQEKSKGPR
jgi:putative autoinducer-2 (AI-2) aldolase